MKRSRLMPCALVGMLASALSAAPAAQGVVPGTNGRIAYESSHDGGLDNVYVMNADGTDQTQLTFAPGQHGAPSWSPDATRIVFHSIRDGNAEIYVMDADGTDQTRLTDHEAVDYFPDWSPDGTRIAFVSNRTGTEQIYVMNVDGTGLNRLTDNDYAERYPTWSPDGNKIAFSSDRDGNREIYVMDADGTDQARLTTNTTWDDQPSWSPDGNKIAFGSNYRVYVMGSDGSDRTMLTTTLSNSPAWSPDGTKIAFASYAWNGGWYWQVFTMDANGSNVSQLTTTAGSTGRPAWGVVPAVYTLEGFFAPVDDDAVNVAKAGQVIPLKFRVTDASGAPITDAAGVTVSVTSLACDLGTSDDLLEEYAAGSSGLQNLGDGYYQYNWKAPKSYANSCKTVTLSLGTNGSHSAEFRFTR